MTGSDKQFPSEDINIRIMQFLKAENLKPSELADLLEVPRSRLSHIKNGRNKPNIEFIIKLLTHFPKLNPDWLLLGIGNMYKTSYHISQQALAFDNSSPTHTPDNKTALEQTSESSPASQTETSDEQTDKMQPIENPDSSYNKVNPQLQKDLEPERILILYPDHTFVTYKERKN